LRICVEANAKEFYKILQKARTGRLNAEFRNRLGWLVGNLYSKVATEDWSKTEAEEKRMVAIIDKLISADVYDWVNKKTFEAATEAHENLEILSREEVLLKLKEYQPIPRKTELLGEIKKVIMEILSDLGKTIAYNVLKDLEIGAELRKQLLSELQNACSNFWDTDQIISSLHIEDSQVKADIKMVLEPIIKKMNEELAQKIINRLNNNAVINRVTQE
jgi:hypothetical protein